jgi:hypothetical protein
LSRLFYLVRDINIGTENNMNDKHCGHGRINVGLLLGEVALKFVNLALTCV